LAQLLPDWSQGITGRGEKVAGAPATMNFDVIAAMPTDLIFDFFAIKLNGPRAAKNPMELNFTFPDLKEKYLVQIKNGVLNYSRIS
jgi:alkyl sulfatase BDS1-like metallo-beta-lactamase superfamily hydrolase